MPKLNIKIIQPHQKKLDETCDQVVVPGIDGDFGVLPGHTAFITKVRPGISTVYNKGGKEKYAIHDGFVTVEQDVVKIVCDVIERQDEIDETRAREAQKRAEERLKSQQGEIDFRRAEYALKRALTRLEISG
jgi:F-type H+-transporting ATPase subunit epsilon